jgi:glycosyltransferase EpsD
MKWCSENGWKVDYCAPNDEIVTECDNHIVLPIPRSPFSKRSLKCIKKLQKILEKEQYDIIHCHTPMGAVIARLAARKLFKQSKVKVIYTAHGFHFYKGAPKLNWMLFYPVEKLCSCFTDKLITINKEDYELAKSKFHAKAVHYVPGVGTESLFARIDEAHVGTEDDPIPYSGNMALENGKYYTEGGKVYRCTRDTVNPVYNSLSALVGLYVEVVE